MISLGCRALAASEGGMRSRKRRVVKGEGVDESANLIGF